MAWIGFLYLIIIYFFKYESFGHKMLMTIFMSSMIQKTVACGITLGFDFGNFEKSNVFKQVLKI